MAHLPSICRFQERFVYSSQWFAIFSYAKIEQGWNIPFSNLPFSLINCQKYSERSTWTSQSHLKELANTFEKVIWSELQKFISTVKIFVSTHHHIFLFPLSACFENLMSTFLPPSFLWIIYLMTFQDCLWYSKLPRWKRLIKSSGGKITTNTLSCNHQSRESYKSKNQF